MKTAQGFLFLSTIIVVQLLSPVSANAQVTYYGIEKTQFYEQTSNDVAPSSTYESSVYAFVDTTAPTDASSFTVTDGSSTINLAGTSTSFGGSDYYVTKAAMDMAFPDGTLATFTGSGGTLGTVNQNLPILPDNYAQEAYVTNTGITNALDLNPSSGYTFDVAYTGTGVSTSTAFAIADATGKLIYDVTGTPDQSSFAVSSAVLDSLAPGKTYTVEIVDFDAVDYLVGGGFGGVKDTDAFGLSTTFKLQIVPEPSTWFMILLGLGLLVFFKAKEARIWPRIVARTIKNFR